MLKLIVGVLAIPSLASLAAQSQSWQDLCPGRTSEAEILRRYGNPLNVVIRFIGFDAFESWRTAGTLSTYDFEYFLPSSGSAIHEGPLGEAHRAVVKFTVDRKLWEVVWTYNLGLRLHYRSGEGPTQITAAQIETLLGGSPIIKKLRPGPSGAIYRFRKDRFVVDVHYLGPGNDIEVSLSRQGSVILE